MNIKVLGPGCKNCKKLFELTKEAIKELNVEIELEYIDDIEKMISYGIMSSPALVINEKVASQGRLISKDDIIKLIKGNTITKTEEAKCCCGGKC